MVRFLTVEQYSVSLTAKFKSVSKMEHQIWVVLTYGQAVAKPGEQLVIESPR